ncbi:MAG: FAD-dependent oxidoreductase, partial [Myxococcales bacterium]|nr:FAD-dependent oxidoreductase [Myxococcales bacterium]
HWLHLRDPDIERLVLDMLGEDHFTMVDRISRIWSSGVYTEYPFQANVHGLPPAVVHECLMGAIEAITGRPETVALEDEPENFADWIRFYFGEGIARHFMVPYNAKLWGVDATEITSRWCQRFVPRPKLEDIVAGAVGHKAIRMGYNARFRYPKAGGIESLPEALGDRVGRERIFLNQAARRFDLDARTVTLADGRTVKFAHLVNTMALTKFIDAIDSPVPQAVRDARAKLRATETVYFNVGVEGPVGQPDHWIYVPELEWPMYRVGVFSNAIPAMAPPGCGSLYVEMADRTTPAEAIAPKVTEGLVAMGLIESAAQVRFMHPRRIPNAYVVYDFNYHAARQTIHDWLATQGVQSIGRYGDWNYSSMEDAMIDGRRAAHRLRELSA